MESASNVKTVGVISRIRADPFSWRVTRPTASLMASCVRRPPSN